MTQLLDHRAEGEVIGPEVVTQGADTVGLVDRDQIHAGVAQCGRVLAGELLGSRQEQLDLPAAPPVQGGAVTPGAEITVDHRRGETVLGQEGEPVTRQGQRGGDDDAARTQ
ncbi:MAG: hypothetical protein ABJA87_00705 [bacterium]